MGNAVGDAVRTGRKGSLGRDVQVVTGVDVGKLAGELAEAGLAGVLSAEMSAALSAGYDWKYGRRSPDLLYAEDFGAVSWYNATQAVQEANLSALQAAILSAAESRRPLALRPNGFYRLPNAGFLRLPSGATVLGNGATLVCQHWTATSEVLLAAGEDGGDHCQILDEGDIAPGASVLRVAAANAGKFQAGDWARIVCSNWKARWPVDASTGRAEYGELQRICQVDASAGLIRLEGGVLWKYPAPSSGEYWRGVTKCGLVEDVEVRDLNITLAGGQRAQTGVKFRNARNVLLRNVSVTGACSAGISFDSVLDSRIERCVLTDCRSPADAGGSAPGGTAGYGVLVANGSRNVVVDGCVMRRCRHGFSAGGPAPTVHLLVQNCVVDGGRKPGSYPHDGNPGQTAFDCHELCFDTEFRRNLVVGDYNGSDGDCGIRTGFNLRGIGSRAVGNTVMNARATGVAVFNGMGGPREGVAGGYALRGTEIAGNRIVNSGTGVSVGYSWYNDAAAGTDPADRVWVDGVRIAGNSFEGCQVGIALDAADNAVVDGNSFGPAGYCGQAFQPMQFLSVNGDPRAETYPRRCSGLTVSSNVVKSSGRSLHPVSVKNASSVRISGNSFEHEGAVHVVYVKNSADVAYSGNSVVKNDSSDGTPGCSVYADGCDGLIVSGSSFRLASKPGQFYQNWHSHLAVWASRNVSVCGCAFYNNKAITFDNSETTVFSVTGNVVAQSGEASMGSYSSEHGVVQGNWVS